MTQDHDFLFFALEGYWDSGFDQAGYTPRPVLPAPDAAPRQSLTIRQAPREPLPTAFQPGETFPI